MLNWYKNDNFVSGAAMVVIVLFLLFGRMYDAWSNPPAGESGLEDYQEVLVKGIMKQRGHMNHVDKKYASKLVQEAIDITTNTKFSWLPPELLLGLAINESDLRGDLQCGYDCGLTQNRVVGFKSTRKARKKLCSNLVKSTKLSFKYAAIELTHIKNRYCKGYDKKKQEYEEKCRKDSKYCARYRHYRNRFTRCLLNNYNQGPHYWKEEDCVGDNKRCRVRARYWQRVICFMTGIRLGKDSRWSCRKAWSIGWIARAYKISKNKVVF